MSETKIDNNQLEIGRNAIVPFLVNVPFNHKHIHNENIINTNILSTDTISVFWNSTTDQDENSKELCNIDFNVNVVNGSFDLTIFSNDNAPLGGEYKLKYKIN